MAVGAGSGAPVREEEEEEAAPDEDRRVPHHTIENKAKPILTRIKLSAVTRDDK